MRSALQPRESIDAQILVFLSPLPRISLNVVGNVTHMGDIALML